MRPPAALDIVIPMAGHGSRFSKAGYKDPKPLIDVDGKVMIERVIENLRPMVPHRFIFLVLREHLEKFNLADRLKRWAGPSTVIVPVNGVTEGAACTVLLAKEHLRSHCDLLIANSDQLVDINFQTYISWSRSTGADGTIMIFEDEDMKWSFVRLDSHGFVAEVAEKKKISNLATVGIYYFRKGIDFVTGAEQMMAKNLRVNGEFYVCPVYNELIERSGQFRIWKIDKKAMHGLGTPEDLQGYLKVAR